MLVCILSKRKIIAYNHRTIHFIFTQKATTITSIYKKRFSSCNKKTSICKKHKTNNNKIQQTKKKQGFL